MSYYEYDLLCAQKYIMTGHTHTQRTVRKTFNISEDNARRMKNLLPQRKQTEFVNQALAHELSRMEKQRKLQSLSEKILKIKRKKITEPVVKTIRKLRKQRDNKISRPPVA